MKKLFDEVPYLENDLLTMHRIQIKDSEVLKKMSDDPQVRKYLPTFLLEYGFDDKKEAIEKMYSQAFANKESLFLGIYLKSQPDVMTGMGEIYNYDANWNKASIGIRLDREHWGKGIAKSAVKLMMDYMLSETDVKRITAHVISENENSWRIFQSLGYSLRKYRVNEDWGFSEDVIVNKYVYEKWGNISYRKIGNGKKTMVILPGLALRSTLGASEEIASNYKDFKDFTIYLFDDRDNIGPEYTLRERAGDVAAEMKMLGLKDACVYGASLGGMVGQYLAIDHPDLVKKLFMTSTASRIDAKTAAVLKRWKELAIIGDVRQLAGEMLSGVYSEEVTRKFGKTFKGGVGSVSEDELEKFAILANAILGINTYDELEKIKCPVCIVGAAGDKVLDIKAEIEMAAKLSCRLVIYGKEYGHAVYDEAPDHRSKILEFFKS